MADIVRDQVLARQGRAIPMKRGDALVTNRRRPILTLVADTSPGIYISNFARADR
jgi:hypothetical protein